MISGKEYSPDFIKRLIELVPNLDPYSRKSFIDHHGRWYYRETLLWLDYFVKKDARILDLGSGYCTFGLDLLQRGYPNVYSVDKNPDKILVAKQLYEEFNQDPNKLDYGNLVDFTGTWDVLISMEVLYMIQARYTQHVFHKAKRLLTPGGYLIFTHMISEDKPKPTRSYLDVYTLADMLRRADLELIKISPRPRPGGSHRNYFVVARKTAPPVRELFITVDGDGFLDHATSFLEKVIRGYPELEFTVSMIENAIAPGKPDHRISAAAEIFGEPNVRVASHSWSHPQDWYSPDVDLDQQINKAIIHLNDFLRYHKIRRRVEAFFWTGHCNPTEEAIKRVDELGLPNFNGFGWDVSPFKKIGSRIQYVQRGFHCTWWKNRAQGEPWGDMAIQFYELHADRPIHLYFHFMAASPERWPSTKRILDWARDQVKSKNAEVITFSEYIERVKAKYGIKEVQE